MSTGQPAMIKRAEASGSQYCPKIELRLNTFLIMLYYFVDRKRMHASCDGIPERAGARENGIYTGGI